VLLAEDETDLLLFPPLRAGWALRGLPREVHISGQNARRVVFGAMNLCTGRRWFLARPRRKAPDFQEFLHLLHWHYRGWHLALLLDEDSSHTASSSLALAKELSIKLIWLPNRSPKLNPLESLWGEGKDVIDANKQYATIDDQVTRFLRYLESLSPREALHASGTLSKHYWLRFVLSKYLCGPA
jgi:hypothetical protein